MKQHENSSNNCCKDVKITPKISDDHNAPFTYVNQEMSFLILLSHFPQDEDEVIPKVPFVSVLQRHPPGEIPQTLYLQYRNLRI